jgi:hypothetical protein
MSAALPIIDSGPSERGWSYYSTVLRCPQLFYWKYVYPKIATRPTTFSDYTEPLARGTIFHVAAAHHYARMWARAHGKNEDLVCPPEVAMKIAAAKIGELGEERLPIVQAMWSAYLQRYPVETFEVVAVEQPAEVLIEGVRLTARIDLIVKEPTGRIFIYDHKSSARMESKVMRRYTLHGQRFGLELLGRKLYGDQFGGVVINHITEDCEFVRKSSEPAPWMARKFPLTITLAAALIESLTAKCGTDPSAWPAFPSDQSCYGPYGACPAIPICQWGPTT